MDEIKIGTVVIVYDYLGEKSVHPIENETIMSWCVKGIFYDKGTLIKRGATPPSRARIQVPTEDDVNDDLKRQSMLSEIRYTNFNELSDEQLEQVIKAIK